MLCAMFIETFAEKRELPKKWYRYALLICMVIMDYVVSVTLVSNMFLKEIVIIG
jgi:hypothetical protein